MIKLLDKRKRSERKALEWLVVLRSADLTERDQQQFFAWLEEDLDHQRAFIKAEQLWARGSALNQVQPQAASNQPVRSFHSPVWFAVVAAVVCCFITAAFVITMNSGQVQPKRYLANDQQTAHYRLEDNTEISLNVASEVEVDFSSVDQRHVTLKRGEVFFDVAPNSDRPFVVLTRHSEVTVLGTEFSVREEGEMTQVTVLEGRVEVSTSSTTSAKTTLNHNDQLVIKRGKIITEKVDAEQVLSWRTGVLKFHGAPLYEVVKELNRYYSNEVVIGDEQVKQMQVIAVLPLDVDLQTNVNYLTHSLPLVAVTDPVTQVVRLLPVDGDAER